MNVSQQILVVDDDPDVRDLVDVTLRSHGFRVKTVEDGGAMAEALASGRFDLVVLDLNLPGDDGLTLCRRLRETPATSTTPVIMLTAVGEETDRIVGLEMGADDYVPKPFNPRELIARVRSVLRRVKAAAMHQTTRNGYLLDFAGWRLDPVKRQIFGIDDRRVSLTSGEFDLLLALAQRPNRVLSRDQLLEMTKGGNVSSFDRSIDLQLSRLRRKIEENPKNPRIIKTIRGSGYVFSCEVRRVAGASVTN